MTRDEQYSRMDDRLTTLEQLIDDVEAWVARLKAAVADLTETNMQRRDDGDD